MKENAIRQYYIDQLSTSLEEMVNKVEDKKIEEKLKFAENCWDESEKKFFEFLKNEMNTNSFFKYALGICYMHGIGVDKNLNFAFKMFFDAVSTYKDTGCTANKEGYCESCYELGVGYFEGLWTKKSDHELALKYFTKYQEYMDSDLGDILFLLGGFYKSPAHNNYKLSYQYFKKAAENNNYNAMFELGKCYFLGKGVDVDKTKSFVYFKNLADKNIGDLPFVILPESCWYVSGFYWKGLANVKKNLDIAVEYLKKAISVSFAEIRNKKRNLSKKDINYLRSLFLLCKEQCKENKGLLNKKESTNNAKFCNLYVNMYSKLIKSSLNLPLNNQNSIYLISALLLSLCGLHMLRGRPDMAKNLLVKTHSQSKKFLNYVPVLLRIYKKNIRIQNQVKVKGSYGFYGIKIKLPHYNDVFMELYRSGLSLKDRALTLECLARQYLRSSINDCTLKRIYLDEHPKYIKGNNILMYITKILKQPIIVQKNFMLYVGYAKNLTHFGRGMCMLSNLLKNNESYLMQNPLLNTNLQTSTNDLVDKAKERIFGTKLKW